VKLLGVCKKSSTTCGEQGHPNLTPGGHRYAIPKSNIFTGSFATLLVLYFLLVLAGLIQTYKF